MSQELVFGIHAVEALLKRSPARISELLVLEGRADKRVAPLVSQAERAGIRIQRLARGKLDQLVSGNHQGVVARVSEGAQEQFAQWGESDLDELIANADKPLVLVLDGVTDPHNLGACLRSADAAGVTAVVVPKDNAVGITPVVRKVACGAAEVVPFIQVTNLARTLKQLQEAGLWIVGTHRRGGPDPLRPGPERPDRDCDGGRGQRHAPADQGALRFSGAAADGGQRVQPQRVGRHRHLPVRGGAPAQRLSQLPPG
jgi:23S rRNA (guanosine2251-2'-O)-methyltransferase